MISGKPLNQLGRRALHYHELAMRTKERCGFVGQVKVDGRAKGGICFFTS